MDVPQVLVQHIANALHDSSGHIDAVMLLTQTPEHALSVGVKFGGVGAHQIGQEQKVVWPPLGKLGVHLVIGGGTHATSAEPLQTDTAAFHHGQHHMGVGQEAVVHGNAGILGYRLLSHDSHRHHSAGGQGHTAGGNVAGADHAGKVIQRAYVDGSAGFQLHGGGQVGFQCACHGAGLCQRGKLAAFHANGIQHFLPVGLFVDVKVEGEGGDGHIALLLAGEIENHIVFQQHIGFCCCVNLRPVSLQPQDLGSGPGGQNGHLTGDCLANRMGELLLQNPALLHGALIHPGDGIHQGNTVSTQYHQRFRLTGKGDLPDGWNMVLFYHICQQIYKNPAVRHRVKFYKAAITDVLHRTALTVNKAKVPIINGNFNIG